MKQTAIRRAGVVLMTTAGLWVGAMAAAQDLAQVDDPESGTTWGITPAPDDDGERVSVRAELDPGETYTDEVVVTNYSERAATFALDASDGVVTETGDFDILGPDQAPTGGGSWIEIGEEVEVGSGESVAVPFTVRVPDDALPGDHPAGITASLAPTDGVDGGVDVDARVGVRLHLRVNGEIQPRLEVTELDAAYAGTWNPVGRGTVTVSWTVTNVGNVRLGSHQLLDVAGPWNLGTKVNQHRAGDQREILPGQSISGSFETEAWPTIFLTADLTVHSSVVGDDRVDAELSTVSDSTRALALPYAQVVVVVVLLGGFFLIFSRLRRQRAYRAELERQLAEARSEKEPSLS